MNKNLKSIHIDEKIHKKIKEFCDKRNLKINKWIETKILEIINNEEK